MSPIRYSLYEDPRSPFARILPWLDQASVANAINITLIDPWTPPAGDVQRTALTTTLSVCLCPSDPPPPVVGLGRINYRFCFGLSPDASTLAPKEAGAFHLPSLSATSVRAQDITDGLAQTVGVSERLEGDWVRSTFKQGGDTRILSNEIVMPQAADATSQLCRSLPSGLDFGLDSLDSRGGESWFYTGAHTTQYNHVAGPNDSSSECGWLAASFLEGRTRDGGSYPATSYHPGGVNVLMMDGSVRFVRDGVSLPVWRGLATIGGGEMVGNEW